MSERSFRLIQGLYILVAMYFELDILLFIYLGVIAFEGLTNWRVPRIVNRLRYGKIATAADATSTARPTAAKFNFEAERALRLVVFVLLVFAILIFPEPGWFFPWFIGAMLLMAGVTNICPMVMMFRYLGFR